MKIKCPYTGEEITIVAVRDLSLPDCEFVSPEFVKEYAELQLVQACIPEWRKVFATFNEKIRPIQPITGRTYVRWLYGEVVKANSYLEDSFMAGRERVGVKPECPPNREEKQAVPPPLRGKR